MRRTPLTSDGREAPLQALDVAADIPDSAATTPEARALVDRIVATDPTVPSSVRPVRRRHELRWAVGATAVAVAGVLAVIQNMDGSEPAFASWSATPSSAADGPLATATDQCRRQLVVGLPAGRLPAGVPAPPTRAEIAAARVLIAERRGDWTLVALGGARNLDASCLVGPDGISAVTGSSSGGGVVVPATGILVGQTVAEVDGASFASFVGRVGRDVTGVTFITQDGRRVTATLTGGHVAAWWPGMTGSSDRAAAGVTAEITLRDGTVRRGVPVGGPVPDDGSDGARVRVTAGTAADAAGAVEGGMVELP